MLSFIHSCALCFVRVSINYYKKTTIKFRHRFALLLSITHPINTAINLVRLVPFL